MFAVLAQVMNEEAFPIHYSVQFPQLFLYVLAFYPRIGTNLLAYYLMKALNVTPLDIGPEGSPHHNKGRRLQSPVKRGQIAEDWTVGL